MKILKAELSHFESIVNLNKIEVQYTSPMDLDRTKNLDACAAYHWVVEIDNVVAGFLLVMDHDSLYENDNHKWFKERLERFLYIDRIVVSKEFAGQKIGSKLYKKLIKTAGETNIKNIVCEYNIQPMNLGSKGFHDSFGFKEMGTLWSEDRSKQVSMQRLLLDI